QLLARRDIPKEQLGVAPNVVAHGHLREILPIRREGDTLGIAVGGEFLPEAALSIADIPDAEKPVVERPCGGEGFTVGGDGDVVEAVCVPQAGGAESQERLRRERITEGVEAGWLVPTGQQRG